jgi:hypothetical protein
MAVNSAKQPWASHCQATWQNCPRESTVSRASTALRLVWPVHRTRIGNLWFRRCTQFGTTAHLSAPNVVTPRSDRFAA